MKSIYLSAIHALPAFRKQGGGCFVNIASTAGLRPRPGLTVYNSSKGAVILMSKSMAAEFGPDKVRVNCVNPVFSPDTALSAEFAGGAVTDEARKAFLATIPLGRFSTAAGRRQRLPLPRLRRSRDGERQLHRGGRRALRLAAASGNPGRCGRARR